MEAIKNLLESAEERLRGKHLILVCNSKSSALLTENESPFRMETEYFSDEEFDQVVSMFNSTGLLTDYFLHEDDFFHYIISENPPQIIVYNAAQSGTGPGRKSLVPAFCNLHGIPCTGSNAYVVSLCRHKYHVNKLLEQSEIPVPKTWLFYYGWLLKHHPPSNSEIILKPIYESASIGIDYTSILNYTDYDDVLVEQRSKLHKQPIIAQQFIPGFEVEVPIICNGEQLIPLAVVGISIDGEENLGSKILDYKRVYFDSYDFYDFYQKDKILSDQLTKCASSVARLLGMEGLCRVDFRIKTNGAFFVTDVSTNPHFIEHSSVHYAFKKNGLMPKEIAEIILSVALNKL